MSRLCIAPIVEGDGEVEAVRPLLERIWREIVGGEYIQILRPILGKRQKLVKRRELERRITLAVRKLRGSCSPQDPCMVLVLLDADDDLPCVLGPRLLELARQSRSDVDVACVVANVDYETWFVAAADSLRDFLDVPTEEERFREPESHRCGKGWIKKHFLYPKYSETVDQPRMTARMDLELCRQRSPSFDKLCRELEGRSSEALRQSVPA